MTTFSQGKAGTPGVLAKREPNGELIERIDAAGRPVALGLDPASDDLFVSDQPEPNGNPGDATLLQLSSSGEELEAYGYGEVAGKPLGNALALSDAAQRLYVTSGEGGGLGGVQSFALPPAGPIIENGSTAASAVRKTTATLYASVNPEGKASTYRIQYTTQAQYDRNEEEGHEGFAGAVESAPASIGEDFSYHDASVALTGLATATAYRFRVIAFNSDNTKGLTGETAAFETLPPALVDASVAQVSASSATLIADINPLGDATSYRFQYITRAAMLHNEEDGQPPFTGAAQVPASEEPVGSGEEPVSVFQHVQGLAPHTEYRYSVLVVNVAAPEGFASTTVGFTTQASSGGAALADGREWELVSPPNKHGALIGEISQEGVIQAADSGGAIAYWATAPTEAEPQGDTTALQIVSARGAGGWSSRDIAGSHTKTTGLPFGQGDEYRLFRPTCRWASCSPSASSNRLCRPKRANRRRICAAISVPPALRNSGIESCYRPLLTAGDVTSGAHFGVCRKGLAICGAEFVGASPDLSHVVLSSSVRLTSLRGDRGGIYEYSEGRLALVSVLPGGAPGEPAAALGASNELVRGAISDERFAGVLVNVGCWRRAPVHAL